MIAHRSRTKPASTGLGTARKTKGKARVKPAKSSRRLSNSRVQRIDGLPGSNPDPPTPPK